jgi:tryptophan synthase
MDLPSRRATRYVLNLDRSSLEDLLISSQVALAQDVDYAAVLSILQDARSKGLKAPVVLMGTLRSPVSSLISNPIKSTGYYNPIFAYGEKKAIQDASSAGANGFITVDLPPEEAIAFRDECTANK